MNELGSDADCVRISDRANNSHFLISESSPSTSLKTVRPLASESELLDVLGTGARGVWTRPSAVWKDRLRANQFPLSLALGSVGLNVRLR